MDVVESVIVPVISIMVLILLVGYVINTVFKNREYSNKIKELQAELSGARSALSSKLKRISEIERRYEDKRKVKSVYVKYEDPAAGGREFTNARSFQYTGDNYVLKDSEGKTVAAVDEREVLYVEIIKEV